MKLRNKQTGKIGYLYERSLLQDIIIVYDVKGIVGEYKSIKGLCKEWEDYEEPKTFWAISWAGEPEEYDAKKTPQELKDMAQEIGNYFDTREEAEKAVEKLKAWKRLKDKGISFEGKVIDRKWYLEPKSDPQQRTFDEARDLFKDVKIIFGGEA